MDARTSLYSTHILPFENKVLTVNAQNPRGGDDIEFRVTIKKAATIDLGVLVAFCRRQGADDGTVLAAITALQSLLRVVSSQKFHQQGAGGNRFFDNDPSSRFPLPQGAELARGFFQVPASLVSAYKPLTSVAQSMRPTISGLRVNLDTAYTAFIKGGNGVDVVLAILGKMSSQGGGGRGRGGSRGGRGGAPTQQRPDPASVRFNERDIVQLRSKLVGAQFTVSHGGALLYPPCVAPYLT